MKNKRSGFTLLEILLVIGIIAILAGIVIIAINPSKQLAQVRNTQRKSDLKQIYNAMTQFYIDNTFYPASTTLSTTTLTEICNTGSVSNTATSTTGINCDVAGLTNLSELVPAYLVSIPVDPSGASSTLTFIPKAYANSAGTGYKIMRTLSNQVIGQAALAELDVPVVVGNVGLSVTPPLISGLVAHYKMNDTSGTTVVDTTGNFNGTSVRNTTLMTTSGRISDALNFNGTTDQISMSPVITGSGAFSVNFWFKLTGGFMFMQGGSNAVSNQGFTLWARTDLGRGIELDTKYGNYLGSMGDMSTPFNGNWHMLTWTYNGSGSNVLILDNNQTTNITYTWNLASVNWIIGTPYGGATSPFDDVRIYNKVLSPAERALLYNSGNGTEVE